MIVVIVDKMLKTQIVECSSVVKWVFSDGMRNELTSFYVWEILHSTINRMSKQVDKLRTEYNELNAKFRKTTLDEEVSSKISKKYNSLFFFTFLTETNLESKWDNWGGVGAKAVYTKHAHGSAAAVVPPGRSAIHWDNQRAIVQAARFGQRWHQDRGGWEARSDGQSQLAEVGLRALRGRAPCRKLT